MKIFKNRTLSAPFFPFFPKTVRGFVCLGRISGAFYRMKRYAGRCFAKRGRVPFLQGFDKSGIHFRGYFSFRGSNYA